jgi:hypothetical protein
MINVYECEESIISGMVRLFREVKATGKAIKPGTVGQNKVREDYKKCSDLFFNDIPDSKIEYSSSYKDVEYQEHLMDCIKDYSDKYLFDEPLDFHSHPKYQWYKPGEGFYAEHFDALGPEQDRVVAFITYLNTVTDGGGTHFVWQDQTVDAVAGKTVLFPASYTHRHKGVVSETQEKLIITGWFRWKS